MVFKLFFPFFLQYFLLLNNILKIRVAQEVHLLDCIFVVYIQTCVLNLNITKIYIMVKFKATTAEYTKFYV